MLSFLIPSATARAAAMVPIMLGIVLAFGADRRSRFASLLMITTVQAISVWNVGVKTAAAQNMVAIGFIQKMLGHDITWLHWLVAAAPFSIALSVGLYFVMMVMLPPETDTVPGGAATVRQARPTLGPMTGSGKAAADGFADPAGVLGDRSRSCTRSTAPPPRPWRWRMLFLPGIGVMEWKQAQSRIPWGTIVLFGVGISLGTALLQTKAAAWVANLVVTGFGLDQLGGLAILAVLAAVPDHHPSGVRQRHRARGGDDPDRHRGAAEGADAGHQRHRHDDGAAIRGQLRVRSAGEFAAGDGGLWHGNVCRHATSSAPGWC